MTGVTQDFIHLHSRVDTINDRMTVLLKGIVYLISLRWAFSRLRHNSNGSTPDLTPVAGSDVVNEVMSNAFVFQSLKLLRQPQPVKWKYLLRPMRWTQIES